MSYDGVLAVNDESKKMFFWAFSSQQCTWLDGQGHG